MDPVINRSLKGTAALVAALLAAATYAFAASEGDAQSLARGAVPDVTPQQKYQSEIREAGGAYKEWQRDCVQFAGDARKSCNREARESYDRDMAAAKRHLQRRES